MKKVFILKTLKLLVVLMLMLGVFGNVAFASSFDVTGTFDGKIDADAQSSATAVQDVLITALTAVRIVGMAVAIIMLIIVGIKIMMASPTERANIKQYSMNYLIGAFILLGASGILTIVQGVANTAFGS